MNKVKSYALDTNIFRYAVNPTGSKNLRRAAKHFWKHALLEFENGKAVLLVPKEVIRELEIQSFSLSDKENRKIVDLLELCQEVSPNRLSPEIEHKIRQITSYVRSNFKMDIGNDKMEYGGVSDARILYTAYTEDAILITANVKDFLLYPLLFPQNEERLYDIKNNIYVMIPKNGYTKIHSDEYFKKLLQDFFELDQES